MKINAALIALTLTATGAAQAADATSAGKVDAVLPITRVYTGSDGLSHFEKYDLKMKLRGSPYETDKNLEVISELMQSPGVYFSTYQYTDHFNTAHVVPLLYDIILTGALEFKLSDGEQRVFGPGSIVLFDESPTAKVGGHSTRGVNNEPRVQLVIPLVRK